MIAPRPDCAATRVAEPVPEPVPVTGAAPVGASALPRPDPASARADRLLPGGSE